MLGQTTTETQEGDEEIEERTTEKRAQTGDECNHPIGKEGLRTSVRPHGFSNNSGTHLLGYEPLLDGDAPPLGVE